MSKANEQKKDEQMPPVAGLHFGRVAGAEKSPYQAHVDNELKHPASVRPTPGESMQPYGLD